MLVQILHNQMLVARKRTALPDQGAGEEPQHLLELEWQADQVVVDAGGQRSVVPYTPQ